MSGKGDGHSLLQRLRSAGHTDTPFRHPKLWVPALAGLVGLAVVGLAPLVWPGWSGISVRVLTLAALWFFLAAPGLWFGMGSRALIISGIIVGVLYGTTAILGLQTPVGDLFVATVITSFIIFAMAGFNLVFILEEMVYDAHRMLRLRSSLWYISPLFFSILLILAVPVLERRWGLGFPATWIGAWATLVLLGSWWAATLVKPLPVRALRELHLFSMAILLATGLADAIHYLQEASTLIPSVVAYLVLLGTWVYVSYTTLQRTHLLLRANNGAPWLAILLAASCGIVAHAYTLFEVEGHLAVEALVGQRITYMVIGVWLGIALLAGRAITRGLRGLGSGLGPRGKRITTQVEKVPSVVMRAEKAVSDVTFQIYRQMDKALPGAHHAPVRHPPQKEDEES